MDDLDKNAVVMSVGQLFNLYSKNRASKEKIGDMLRQKSTLWLTTFSKDAGFKVITGEDLYMEFVTHLRMDPNTVLQITPTCDNDMQHLTTLRLGLRDVLGQTPLSDVMPSIRIDRNMTSLPEIVMAKLLDCTACVTNTPTPLDYLRRKEPEFVAVSHSTETFRGGPATSTQYGKPE
jgi:hypothetical protein